MSNREIERSQQHEAARTHIPNNEESVHIEGFDTESRIGHLDTIKVDHGQNEARAAALGILADPAANIRSISHDDM